MKGAAEMLPGFSVERVLGFDDILLWMTREELALAVRGDIPPLPRMVIAYFP